MKIESPEVEAVKQIIRKTTVELMDIGGSSPETVCEVLADAHPYLCAALGANRVLALCCEIHDSNEPVESARLQELFVKFRAKYFSERLGDFKVLAVYNAAGASMFPISGWVDFVNREIRIAITECPDWMPKMLLHHMAHASTVTLDDSEEAWINEMQRLRQLGAPVEEDWIQ